MPIPQSCIEALLIESRLSLPYAFRYKKFAWDPPNEPYHFLCEMAPYIEICYAYSGGAGGSQKFRLFVTAGLQCVRPLAAMGLIARAIQTSIETISSEDEDPTTSTYWFWPFNLLPPYRLLLVSHGKSW